MTEREQEYGRLIDNPDYREVRINPANGGLSAVHINHRFDKTEGAFGKKRGEYELAAVEALREHGHYIRLEAELGEESVKSPDGLLDGMKADIKAIEGVGKWAVKDKIREGAKQGAECIVLYFPERRLYSSERVATGWRYFMGDKDSERLRGVVRRVVCIVEGEVKEFQI